MRVSTTPQQAPLPGLAPSMPAPAAIPAPPDDYATLFGLPSWVFAEVKRADGIAQAARAARLAGDLEQARALDAEFDAIYDRIDQTLFLGAEIAIGAIPAI